MTRSRTARTTVILTVGATGVMSVATIVLLWLAAFLVLLIHAASQGVAPEFALPVYPIFIVAALGALAGDRGPRAQLASTA